MATPRKKPVTKKKPTKKKAPAKKKAPTKKVGAKRPSFTVNAAAARKSTARQSIFYTVDPGNHIMRILPPYEEDRKTAWIRTALHFTVKDVAGDRNIAPACLHEHGDGNCYICDWIDWLKASNDAIQYDIGHKMRANIRYCVQAFIFDVASKEWMGPKIVKLTQKPTNTLSAQLSVAEDSGQAPFCDPHRGQSVILNRVGTGMFDTAYEMQMIGNMFDMDDDIPDWFERGFSDLWAKLDIKVLDINAQKEALYATHPDLPWEDIQKDIG